MNTKDKLKMINAKIEHIGDVIGFGIHTKSECNRKEFSIHNTVEFICKLIANGILTENEINQILLEQAIEVKNKLLEEKRILEEKEK